MATRGVPLVDGDQRTGRGAEGEQHQQRHRSLGEANGAPVQDDVTSDQVVFGDPPQGRGERGDVVLQPWVAVGQPRPVPRPAEINPERLLANQPDRPCGRASVKRHAKSPLA